MVVEITKEPNIALYMMVEITKEPNIALYMMVEITKESNHDYVRNNSFWFRSKKADKF